MNQLYVGLVHHPIINKRGEVITTSVTNLDIHDISRSCKTFGVKNFFIITPILAQHKLVGRILGHWEEDKASDYNPDRQQALAQTKLAMSIAEVVQTIEEGVGVSPMIAVTGANFSHFDGDAKELKLQMKIDNRPCLLLFGTGWGLNKCVLQKADFSLNPILGCGGDYNHLSVRSAVAIYLDRLQGNL